MSSGYIEPKSVPTWYEGIRYRSLLEAQYARAFDELRVEHKYEPRLNGSRPLIIPRTVSGMKGEFPYLPDFLLPGLGLYVEVKGPWWNRFNQMNLLDAAAYLSGGTTGQCGRGYDMLVLGPLPDLRDAQGRLRVMSPWALHMHDGELIRLPWLRGNSDPSKPDGICNQSAFAVQVGITGRDVFGYLGQELLEGVSVLPYMPYWWLNALDAARSAHFELNADGGGLLAA